MGLPDIINFCRCQQIAPFVFGMPDVAFEPFPCDLVAAGLGVKFPPEVVGRYLQVCPPSFTFRGRDPQFDRTIPDCGPVVVTGSNGESKSAMMCQAAQRFVAAAPDGAVCIVRLCGVTELR